MHVPATKEPTSSGLAGDNVQVNRSVLCEPSEKNKEKIVTFSLKEVSEITTQTVDSNVQSNVSADAMKGVAEEKISSAEVAESEIQLTDSAQENNKKANINLGEKKGDKDKFDVQIADFGQGNKHILDTNYMGTTETTESGVKNANGDKFAAVGTKGQIFTNSEAKSMDVSLQ